MSPFHVETGSPGGTVHAYTEGSRDTLLDIWLHTLYWISGLGMTQPIYESTSLIDGKIVPSHQ